VSIEEHIAKHQMHKMRHHGAGRARIISVLLGSLLSLLLTLVVLICVLIVHQKRKDKDADRIASLIMAEIAQQGPHLRKVSYCYNFWASHRPPSATWLDRLWNRKYPCIAGTVTAEEHLNEVRDIIRKICEENDYDYRVVAFAIRLDQNLD
jgi:hypothetical protein